MSRSGASQRPSRGRIPRHRISSENRFSKREPKHQSASLNIHHLRVYTLDIKVPRHLFFYLFFFLKKKILLVFPLVFGALKGNQILRNGCWTVSAPLYGYRIASICSCAQSLTLDVTFCTNKMKSAEEGKFNFFSPTVAVALVNKNFSSAVLNKLPTTVWQSKVNHTVTGLQPDHMAPLWSKWAWCVCGFVITKK